MNGRMNGRVDAEALEGGRVGCRATWSCWMEPALLSGIEKGQPQRLTGHQWEINTGEGKDKDSRAEEGAGFPTPRPRAQGRHEPERGGTDLRACRRCPWISGAGGSPLAGSDGWILRFW